MSIFERDVIREEVLVVKEDAKSSSCCCGGGSGGGCCSSKGKESPDTAHSKKDLKNSSQDANMGGFTNPITIASLKQGEIVVDLGSGSGSDSFFAASQVGKSGKIIGVDKNGEMISTSRENSTQGEYANVEFRLGEIEDLPIENNFVDVVLANCVINFLPDKQRAFNESFRILRADGRLAMTDIMSIGTMPESLAQKGNSISEDTSNIANKMKLEKMLQVAGFTNINITLKQESGKFNGAELDVCTALITATKEN